MLKELNTADNGRISTSQIPLFFSISLDVTFDSWKNRNCIPNTFSVGEMRLSMSLKNNDALNSPTHVSTSAAAD